MIEIFLTHVPMRTANFLCFQDHIAVHASEQPVTERQFSKTLHVPPPSPHLSPLQHLAQPPRDEWEPCPRFQENMQTEMLALPFHPSPVPPSWGLPSGSCLLCWDCKPQAKGFGLSGLS